MRHSGMGRDVPKPFNWKDISPPFHRLCADLNSRTRGSQPTRPLFQTDISGSGGNPSQPSEPPGKLSGPAGRGSVTESSRKCLCNSGEVQPGIQPVSLSFSRFSPTPPPGPGADSKKPDTKKAIYLASHFLDSLSNYFSYLYLNERFLCPAQCLSASSDREALAACSLLRAGPSWAWRLGELGAEQGE